MEHRGYIILNHDLTDIEKERIKKSRYVQLYNDFSLKILGGSHFLTLRETITLLYPNDKNIKVENTEKVLTSEGVMLILNDYDSYLDDPNFRHVDFKLPDFLDDVSIDQLEFLKDIIQEWNNYTEIIYIGIWPEELKKVLYIEEVNNSLEQNISILTTYIHLIEQRLDKKIKKLSL